MPQRNSGVKEAGGSTIVTIASDLGVRPIPERIGYCPSKAGVIMLTKCMALEYAPSIRVNCNSARSGPYTNDRAAFPGSSRSKGTGGVLRKPVSASQNGQD